MDHTLDQNMQPPNTTGKLPSILLGGLVGGLVMIPFIVLFFLAFTVLDLPFVPFDVVFPGVRDLTPGDVITLTIDTIVNAINTFNLGRTDTAAKAIEQVMGVGMLVGIGVLSGAVVFGLSNRSNRQQHMAVGLGVGLALGLVMVFFFNASGLPTSVDPFISQLWILVSFLAFGLALSWVYRDLAALPVTSPVPQAGTTASVQGIDRRQFMVRVGGASATLTVIGAGLGALLAPSEEGAAASTASLPQTTAPRSPSAEATAAPADGDVTAAPGTRPEYTPLDDHYRIDISARPPTIDGATWRLNVTGLVAQPLSYSLDQLMNDYEPFDYIRTMGCISNRIGGDLISTTRWTGVKLNTLLDEWALAPEAAYLYIRGADGFDEYIDLAEVRADDRIMLCYAWDGQPLKQKHGFPLRIMLPARFGMKQPKWITDIEVVDSWEEGYWVRRGWSASAFVQTTSVIDTVAVRDVAERDGQMFVPVGGIAWSGDRQISRVEVKVDDGEWQEAQLRTPLSDLAWVIWRYDWPFAEGRHTFAVRCVDGEGTPQTESVQGVRPDGATGIHALTASA